MFIFRVLSYTVIISACVTSVCILRAQSPAVKRLESDIRKPLLLLPEREADLRYHIESAKGVNIFWIANRGKSEVHFVPIMDNQDGKPQTAPEDKPNKPSQAKPKDSYKSTWSFTFSST